MKTYRLYIEERMCGTLDVEAESLEEARAKWRAEAEGTSFSMESDGYELVDIKEVTDED